MIHCNTGFVLHYNILLMQPFRVSSVDVGRQAEPRNSRALMCSMLYAFASASILAYSTWCINANILHGIRAIFLWSWFSVLAVYLRAIFIFLSVFFRCVHLLWLPTVAIKTLRYSQAIIRSRINTTRPLPSSNYRHRAKLHSRDLFNLIKSQDFIKFPS